MNDIIYLEPDAEITSVIDKIRKSQNNAVVLVIPRGGTLAQSIINLKLLMRIAKEHGKAIALVSGDKTSTNLANQLKISIFSKVSEAEKAHLKPLAEDTPRPSIANEDGDHGIKVNTYQRYSLDNLNAKAEANPEDEENEQDSHPETESQHEETAGENIDQEEPRFERRKIHHEENAGDEVDEPKANIKRVDISSESREQSEKQQDVRVKKHIKTEGSRKLFFAIIVAVALVLSLAVTAFLLPRAEATIVLKTRDIDEKINILVSSNQHTELEKDQLAVAGQMLEVEKESTKTIESTGKKNIGEKAKGTITIYNLYNYQNPVKLIKGAKLTGGGKSFFLQNDVTIPVAKATAAIENNIPVLKTVPGSADVEVVAEESGETYNLKTTKFVFPSYGNADKFYAENKTAFTGGTSKEVKVVKEGDLIDAETALKTEMTELATIELLEKAATSNLKILESQISSEVISKEASKKVDEEAEKFDFKLKLKFFVIAFSEADVKKGVVGGIGAKIKADEMIINPEGSEITYQVVESEIDDARMDLEATFRGKVGAKLSAETVKSGIKNKSRSSAEAYLNSIAGLETASLRLEPGFWKRTPFTLRRINIKFDYKK